ncbi:hypothetical protein SDC9_126861 [bioreactor metagenome]|uniref:Uncharacterized protein n=1 Tax=bioreactor metagenome TaxID=1076179 RepID=A0A645CSD4_9ZZZZ
MRNISDLFAQLMLRYVANIHAGDKYGSAGYIIKAHEKADDGRLSRAGCADKSGGFSWLCGEVDVAQHIVLTAGISEIDISKLDDGFESGGEVLGDFLVEHGFFTIHHLLHAIRGNDCARNDDKHHGKEHKRHDDLHRILHIGHHAADIHVEGGDRL